MRIEEREYIEPESINEETGIPFVATNDVHYVNCEDSYIQKILICIATNHTVDEENSLEFSREFFW